MKIVKIIILSGILSLPVLTGRSQDCAAYYETDDCLMDRNKEYKIYSQSRSSVISIDDTLEFRIVFYGNMDYICSFCTQEEFSPVNFRFLDPDTRDVLYDNRDDEYIQSLKIDFDVAKNLIVQVNVLALNSKPGKIKDDSGCIGLLIQYKNNP